MVLVLMMVVVVVSVVWGSVNAHNVELDACRPHVDGVEAARRQQRRRHQQHRPGTTLAQAQLNTEMV